MAAALPGYVLCVKKYKYMDNPCVVSRYRMRIGTMRITRAKRSRGGDGSNLIRELDPTTTRSIARLAEKRYPGMHYVVCICLDDAPSIDIVIDRGTYLTRVDVFDDAVVAAITAKTPTHIPVIFANPHIPLYVLRHADLAERSGTS
jgi:hypothetical protein